ncbi:MAG TPA: hypothetical protein ENN53_06050 [Candidatus Acetothermia bacterium]|nr:hypothetical protein [Candidatus Acetothermia bacterium]
MDRVFARHVELMARAGVPEEEAQRAVAEKRSEDRITGQIRNYERLPALANLLGIAYMNIHTPLGEIGRRDLIAHFRDRFGEFRHALTEIQCPVGDLHNRLGRVAAEPVQGP